MIRDAKPTLWTDLMELMRIRLNILSLTTTAVGFLLASGWPLMFGRLCHTLVATALVAAGSSVLNQVMERRADAQMPRTANRPLPTGRMRPDVALILGALLSAGGIVYLLLVINPLTALLASATLAIYLFVYTPLKRVSSLATVVGAIPGAIPPMMGWTAVRDSIDAPSLVLFGILFLWQMPHFLAIAWMYRSDYAGGGMPMLSVVAPENRMTGRQAVFYGGTLLPVSLLPTVVGLNGLGYLVVAGLLSVTFLAFALMFFYEHSDRTARWLMLASVIYLPLLLTAMVVDRFWFVVAGP